MARISLRPPFLVTDATHAVRVGRTLVAVLVMLMAASFLVAPPASAQGATDTNLTGKDIEAMLPAQVAGWVRASVRSHDARPVLEANYQKEGVPYGIELFLGYDAAHRRTVRGFMENARANGGEAAVQEIERKGRPLHLIESASEGRMGLVAHSGEMAAMFLICGEASTCTVPDPEAARNELFALYDDFGVERLAARGATAEEDVSSESPPSPGDVLRPLVPETLDGLARGAVQSHSRRPTLRARYGASDGRPRLEVQMAYGTAIQQRLQRGLSENSDELETVERGGRTLYLREEPSAVSFYAFPGRMTLMVGIDGADDAAWDADAARERLLRVYDALDPERLTAFRIADDDPDVEVPAGFTTYAADLDDAQVAFAHPEGWTVVDLHQQTGFVQGVTVVRDAEAAEELFADGLSLSSEDTSRLVTPDNVIVTIAVMGEGLQAESFLGSLIRQPTLREPTVAQAPTETPVGEHSAFEAVARGQDADGRPAVQRQLAFTAGGVLFSVSILQPAGTSSEIEEAMQRLLGSLRVTTR